MVKEISALVHKMVRFENLINEELKILAKTKSIDGYKNMSRQQLESISTTPSAPKS